MLERCKDYAQIILFANANIIITIFYFIFILPLLLLLLHHIKAKIRKISNELI